MDAYREQLPEYQYVMGPKTGEEDFWDYNPIFWKAERFALIDSGGFWLSRTPDHWSKDWGTDDAHGVTWVKLRCTRTNRVFLHLNTHFEHISEQSRVESCRLILQKVGELQEEQKPQSLPTPTTGLKVASTRRSTLTSRGQSTKIQREGAARACKQSHVI